MHFYINKSLGAILYLLNSKFSKFTCRPIDKLLDVLLHPLIDQI